MYNHDVNVEIPNDLLKEMESEGVLVSSMDTQLAVLVLSRGMKRNSTDITVRVYSLLLDEKEEVYFITNELEAFSFMEYEQARQFIEHLPRMSAIEM